ncbi:MAG: hypothetical protein NVSMB56_13820 [Pyrinomonadaceae bacterium]
MKFSLIAYRIMFVSTVLLFTVSFVANIAAQNGKSKRVKFPPGRTSAILKGGVIRGERDRYLLGASKGQTMIVHITSREKNAVFQIFDPQGHALQGAEEGTDAMDWTGELPRSGDYTIVVGGTRGNASYTLEVAIR